MVVIRNYYGNINSVASSVEPLKDLYAFKSVFFLLLMVDIQELSYREGIPTMGAHQGITNKPLS